MRILFVASEVYPLAKTGGLADVAGSLPKELVHRGHLVSIIMPRYGSLKLRAAPEKVGSLAVPMGGGKTEAATLLRTTLEGKVPVYLVDHPAYFGNRAELYGQPDDGLRFAFFSRAVVEAAKLLDLRPEVVHCHDWHTGLVPAYLRWLLPTDGPERPAAVFTIHNLAYQGVCAPDVFAYSGLPASYFHADGLEFYGNLSFMKGGIIWSDRVNTVSPTYAREIQTPQHGHGLDGLLRHISSRLSGIVNGIDYAVWDPRQDPLIPARFGQGDAPGKTAMKRALLREMRLEEKSDRPLVSFVGRLVDQKGMDIIMPILPAVLEEAQVVILGTGDPHYHKRLQVLDGEELSIHLKYDEELAHRIYAGSDLFLMPSWFEPCGLGQLIALRYGTLPIVRRTGGLADTVRDADEDPESGTGFSFEDYRPEPLLDAFQRALRAYRDRSRWAGLTARAMAQDFSWDASTREYEKLYSLARRGS